MVALLRPPHATAVYRLHQVYAMIGLQIAFPLTVHGLHAISAP
jgi:hypothetical protein